MKAIILAAGRGSRMGRFTDYIPKGMLLVDSKPLIEHQINVLNRAGIKEIAIVTGYEKEKFLPFGTKHFYNSQWASTNMVFSLYSALEWLNNDDCIVSYADILYQDDIIKSLIKDSSAIAIGYDPNWLLLWEKRFDNPCDDAESFKLSSNGYLVDIGSKINSTVNIDGQYMGLLKFKKAIFEKCFNSFKTKLNKKIDMTSFLSLIIHENIYPIKALKNTKQWFEFDTAKDLVLYNSL
jgi:choline kinase